MDENELNEIEAEAKQLWPATSQKRTALVFARRDVLALVAEVRRLKADLEKKWICLRCGNG